MTVFHLVRHGETNWNAQGRCQGQSESELNERGRQQAQRCQAEITRLNISAIYCSTSVRTRQTAEIITKGIKAPLFHQDTLREIYVGRWETRLWSDIEAQDPAEAYAFKNTPHTFNVPGMESYYDLSNRGVQALETIFEKEASGNVLVVSHGALIKATLSHYAQVDMQHYVDLPALSNCSRSVIEFTGKHKREIHTIDSVDFIDTSWGKVVDL